MNRKTTFIVYLTFSIVMWLIALDKYQTTGEYPTFMLTINLLVIAGMARWAFAKGNRFNILYSLLPKLYCTTIETYKLYLIN